MPAAGPSFKLRLRAKAGACSWLDFRAPDRVDAYDTLRGFDQDGFSVTSFGDLFGLGDVVPGGRRGRPERRS
jgi:hypothetical protein